MKVHALFRNRAKNTLLRIPVAIVSNYKFKARIAISLRPSDFSRAYRSANGRGNPQQTSQKPLRKRLFLHTYEYRKYNVERLSKTSRVPTAILFFHFLQFHRMNILKCHRSLHKASMMLLYLLKHVAKNSPRIWGCTTSAA